MHTCTKLPVLCVVLLAILVIGDIFCNDFSTYKEVNASSRLKPMGQVEIANSGFFKSVWQNSKRRRSVRSVKERTDGEPRSANPAQTTNKPQFECGDRHLTLILNPADVMQMRIYGPLGEQLNVGQLAAFCGVSVRTTHTDVRLLFGYDSCYVKQEAGKYVLSLSWYGSDMTLSCPLSLTPPSLTCKKNAMELTVAGEGTADELSVALNGEWAPLLYVATQCWHREPSSGGELTFLVPYSSCGVNFRDGRYNLDVRSKDKMMPLFCPYEPTPVIPVKDPLSAQPQPQKWPGVYYKPPAVASHIVKQEQRLEPHDRSTIKSSKPPSLQPRGPWVPKIPNLPSLLPGAFNLAVNFPFSLSVPTQKTPEPLGDHVTSKPVFSTPAPTSSPTPSSSEHEQEQQELAPSVQNWQPHHFYPETFQRELSAPVTGAPNPQLHPYMQYPYVFPKPASTPHTDLSVREYQHSSSLVPGTVQYLPSESAQRSNVFGPHQQQVNNVFSKLSQNLPPGYFLCLCNNQQPGLQLAQPDTSTTAPTSHLMAVKLPSQTNPYPPYGAFQATRPLQPQHNQKPSGLVQQPGSTSHTPVKFSSQESGALLSSSYAPWYGQYQAGGDQYLDPSRRFSEHSSGTEILSHLPYQQSQQSRFPYSQRPEVLSVNVSPENTGSSLYKGFFQPRSLAPASLQAESVPPTPKSSPLPQLSTVKGRAQATQLPYSQGPSFRYIQNPFAQLVRPSESNYQRPQNDTLPQYQSYSQGGQIKDVLRSSYLRPTSQEEGQQSKKISHPGLYFYRPPATDTRK